MKIRISELNYHFNELDKNEENYIYSLIANLKKKTNNDYKNISKLDLFNMITSILMENKEHYESLDEVAFYNELNSSLKINIPLIKENEKELKTNKFSYYEPKMVSLFYNINYLMKKLRYIIKGIDTDEDVYLLFLNNILRTIKAIVILIFNNDDAHATALTRGLIESISKLEFMCAYDCKKEFVLFSRINSYIQIYKLNKNTYFDKDTIKFLKEHNLKATSSDTENYLLYQWMHNDEITIKNGKELVNYIMKNNEFLKLYHVTSEFVHEDYNTMTYNWIAIRDVCKTLSDNYFDIVKDHVEESINAKK